MSEQEETSAEAKKVSKKIAQVVDYQRVFGSEQGKRVLADLMDKHFVMTPTAPSKIDPYEMSFNEGQRMVVLRILATLQIDPIQMKEKMEAAHEYVTE